MKPIFLLALFVGMLLLFANASGPRQYSNCSVSMTPLAGDDEELERYVCDQGTFILDTRSIADQVTDGRAK